MQTLLLRIDLKKSLKSNDNKFFHEYTKRSGVQWSLFLSNALVSQGYSDIHMSD